MKTNKVIALLCAAAVFSAALTGCSENGSASSETTAAQTTVSSAESETAESEENAADAQENAENTTLTAKITSVENGTVTAEVGEISSSAPNMGGNGGTPPEMPNGETNSNGSTPPEKPDGEANSDGSTPPEKPDGEANSDGSTPPDKPDGEANSDDSTPPEKPDGEASSNGSTPPEKPDGEANSNGSTPPEKPDGEANSDGSTPPEKPDGEANSDGSTPPEKPDGEANSNGGNPPSMPGGSSFQSSGETITFTVSDDTGVTLEFLQGSGEGTLDDIAVGAVVDAEIDGEGRAVSVTIRNLNVGGFGGSSEVSNGTAATTLDSDAQISGETYQSSGDDENALRIDGAAVTLDGVTIEKNGGSSSNTENGDFYGANAGLLAMNGATVTITGATVNTDAVNGNGVFSYGSGTTVNISDSTIRTSQRNSGGIQTTGGGTTNATNLDVETQGNSSAAIRSDRGGGTVNVDGGTYVTNGTGSPAIYCTADISAKNAALTANNSEGVVVEGKNSVSLENCTVTANMSGTYNGDSDENIHAIMIYQSMSGDADVGEAHFSAEGGSITALSGDMFYVTNTDCTISLKNVAFTLANDTFLRIEGNSSSRGWGTSGANGGDVVFTAESQEISGNILVDSISSLDMTLTDSVFSGAVNPDGEGGSVKVTLGGNSTWTLTADSYITEFDGDISQITANGFHLYVNGEAVV